MAKKHNQPKKKQNTAFPKFFRKRASFITVIRRGISVEGGILKGDGNVHIDGYYVGDINIEGDISIGPTGAVYGDITANSATIGGNCKGTIQTQTKIQLSATAVVEGLLESRAIVIDENAVFNGTCKMESQVQLPSKIIVANVQKKQA